MGENNSRASHLKPLLRDFTFLIDTLPFYYYKIISHSFV